MKDLETELQHFDPIELNSHNRPLTYPIYQSVKFEQDTFEHFASPVEGDFFYSRISNPTVRQLEVILAKLQGREDALAFSSGVSALAVPLIALLKSGDHVIFFAECYLPTRYLIRDLLEKFGVSHTLLFYDQIGELEKHVRPNTRMIHFESPTNPVLIVPDIAKIVSVAKQFKILTFMDNTLAGPHQHGDFDVDIFAHSLTKFVSGHGDVLGGAVIANKSLIQKMKGPAMNIGSTLDPHSAFLILRGLKTYFVRYRAQSATAMEVAKYLSNHSKIKKVIYPGLPSDEGHALAAKQMKDFGVMIAAELSPEVDRKDFFNRLKYFRMVGSLGSTESLIVPCKMLFGGDLAMDHLARARITENTIRLSIGLESAKDLIQDLELALI